jgi:T4-like virus Myoviridae tail sheath stabiliser
MLQHNPFYWGTIRKVVVAFGAIFSDIHIWRMDKAGNPVKKIEVPCEFGPKEKWMTLNQQNPMPGVDDQVEMVLPRMSYEITGFSYDSDRKLTSTGNTVRVVANDKKAIKTQMNPVPYNVSFNLNIMVKTMEDGLMVVEQILPFFTPDYTVTVKDIPDLELSKDIPIILNSVNYEDTWDGAANTRRTVIWTLGFTAKAYLYPPVGLSKLNLKTNVVWHLSQSMTADVSAMDIITPSPESVAPNYVVPNIVQTLGYTFQQQSGTCRIRRAPIQNQFGVSTISLGQSGTPHITTQSGVTAIVNPEAFHPGFQEEPVLTNTELTLQLQKGTGSIAVVTTQTQTGTCNIVSSFDNSFQPGAFQ